MRRRATRGEADVSGVVLAVKGDVEDQMAWNEEQIRTMNTFEAERENEQGKMSIHAGVDAPGAAAGSRVGPDASTVSFVDQDHQTTDADLADVLVCDDCIVSLRNLGGFSIVMPAFSKQLQMKGVVEFQVE